MEERLLIGLGNPGPKYRQTRHNAGFRLIDRWVRRFGASPHSDHPTYLLWSGFWHETRVFLMKPMTYMNLSGHALAAFAEHRELNTDRLLVAYDDVALPLGTIRLRPGGSSGGQKGMRHIIDTLGTDRIPRLRVGIRSQSRTEPHDLVRFVLSAFEPEEKPLLDAVLDHAENAGEQWLSQDMGAVMAEFNTKKPITVESLNHVSNPPNREENLE